MPDPLTIDFALTGADKVLTPWGELAKAADAAVRQMTALTLALNRAAGAYRDLNAEAQKYSRLTGNSPAINIGRGAVRTATTAPASERFAAGPFQQQERLAAQLARANAQGNGRASADIQIAQGRNEKAIERAMSGPKSLGSKLADVMKTSRFSVVGGKADLMPLVGKSLGVITEALGPEIAAVAGPVGLVVTAATAAAKALFDLTKASAEAGASYAKFSYAVGSNGPDAAKALSVGRMAGLDANGTASLANSLNSAITGSAMGRSFGMRVGVFNQGAPYGNMDTSGQLVRAIEGLRSIKSFGERVRTMNELGLQGASAAVMMPQKQYDLHRGDEATTSSIMGQDFQEKSLAFQDSLSRVGAAWDNLMTVVGKPAMQNITDILNSTADGLNRLAVFLNSPAMQTALNILEHSSAFGSVFGVVAAATQPNNPEVGADAHTQAVNRNTEATRHATEALQRIHDATQTPGVYGRDTDGRLGRAFGAGVGFGADSRAREGLMKDGYAMGAF